MLSSSRAILTSLLFRTSPQIRTIHYRKMVKDETLIKSRYQNLSKIGRWTNREQEHGKNHQQKTSKFPKCMITGLSYGFSLGLLGLLENREHKLSKEEEDELVKKFKTGITTLLNGKYYEADQILGEVWEMSQYLEGVDPTRIPPWLHDSAELNWLFEFIKVASLKMDLDLISEASLLEVCTKIFQFYDSVQRDKIRQAIKEENAFQLVALVLEILAQAVTIMDPTWIKQGINKGERTALETMAQAIMDTGVDVTEVDDETLDNLDDTTCISKQDELLGAEDEGPNLNC